MNVYALLVGVLVMVSLCVALETGPLMSALQIDKKKSQPSQPAVVHRRQKRTGRLVGDILEFVGDTIEDIGFRLHRPHTQPYDNWAYLPTSGYPVFGPVYGPGYAPVYGPAYPPVYNPVNGPNNGPGYSPGYPAYGPSYSGNGFSQGQGIVPGYSQGYGQGFAPGFGPGSGAGYSPGYAPNKNHGGSYGPGSVGPTIAPGQGSNNIQPNAAEACSYDPQIDNDSAQC